MISLTKYVKTVPVEAIRFDGSKEMIDRYELGHRRNYEKPWLDQTTVWTLEGEMQIIKGDWLVTGVNGEHWAIKNDIFKKSYAELPVVPKVVSKTLMYAKKKNCNLSWVFRQTPNDLMKLKVITQSERQKFSEFFRTSNSNETFARAWLDGYVVAD